MATIGDHYALAFSSERFFGLEMVINWVSLIILLWIIGLAYLVWRSDSKNLRNRFMATLLLCEGFKGLWQAVNIVPYSHELQHIWDYTWILKIDVFFTAQIAALFLYFLFPVYFKIDKLKFMYRESLQKYAWCAAPILAIIVWLVIKDLPPFTLTTLVMAASVLGAAAAASHRATRSMSSFGSYSTHAVPGARRSNNTTAVVERNTEDTVSLSLPVYVSNRCAVMGSYRRSRRSNRSPAAPPLAAKASIARCAAPGGAAHRAGGPACRRGAGPPTECVSGGSGGRSPPRKILGL